MSILWSCGICIVAIIGAVQAVADDSWFQPADAGRFSLTVGEANWKYIDAAAFFEPKSLEASAQAINDAVFGEGRRFRLSDGRGKSLDVSRHRGTALTLLRAQTTNSGVEPTTARGLDVVELTLNLGMDLKDLRMLGTGGLAPAAAPQGSYMWIAVADPRTRRGVVVGWLGGDRASGVVLPKVVDGRLTLVARLEFGKLRLAPGKSESFEPLAVGWFDDVRLGLEAYADAVAGFQKVNLADPPCGYCTWYHAAASSEKQISKLAEFAAKELKPFGFSVIQIDDGWQSGRSKNGPRKNFTTHRPFAPYPSGMKATAERISNLALTPGLWFMPFAGTWDDPFFADRQDWFAKRENGKPFDTSWGGTCMDMTRPQVQEYLRENVRRMTQDWGYRYLKMDGLWTGSATDIQYVNDAYKDDHMGDAVLSNPDKTNVEALRDGLRVIRQAAGKDVFLLGCCAPQNMRSYGGAFGLVDAMRIGPDNGANQEGLLVGPRYGSRNYFLNGRVWWNDPDPVYVRPALSRAQAELSATWAAIAGQLTIASDDLPSLPAARLNVLKRIMPQHRRFARPVDLFDRELPRVWVIPSGSPTQHTVVGLFQWEQDRLSLSEPLERLGLDPKQEYAAFEFWSNRLLPPVHGRLETTLEPIGSAKSAAEEKTSGVVRRCCASLAVRPLQRNPQLLSTSRHVTGGLVDVLKEEWDEKARRLSGVSRVVGDDSYELRFLTRSTTSGWKLAGFQVGDADAAAGVKASIGAEESGLARATLQSRSSREVSWTATFVPLTP